MIALREDGEEDVGAQEAEHDVREGTRDRCRGIRRGPRKAAPRDSDVRDERGEHRDSLGKCEDPAARAGPSLWCRCSG